MEKTKHLKDYHQGDSHDDREQNFLERVVLHVCLRCYDVLQLIIARTEGTGRKNPLAVALGCLEAQGRSICPSGKDDKERAHPSR
jgi:hypothetical protein